MALKRSSDFLPSIPSIFNNLFRGDSTDWFNFNFSDTNTTLPAVNVKETDNEYNIEVAAPGMKKDDFKINFDRGVLTISSEKHEEKEEKKDSRFRQREFSYQSFQRSFSIPEGLVQDDKIQAKYTDGILHIILPKREELKPKPAKEIQIS